MGLFQWDGPAEAAPRDLCALVDSAEWARIVPQPRAEHRTLPQHEVSNEAACDMTSARGWVKKGRYGYVHVGLERHGTTRYDSGWGEARSSFNWSKEYDAGDGSVPRPVPGLGDDAFAEAHAEAAHSGSGARAEAEVTVLLGRDVLTVDYTAEPSSPDRARRVAVAVARTVLGEL
ncbi:hypothetical protein [Streptomyces sp. NBC_01361]|uniref:hypothetical protein n=1 Tax=Streptomyces sp. NBC_01361 TaxID=2903838 RepID=UPI002E327FBE|nr:hypothetical protein [Streptomyces sp. NBC_01361]